MKSLLLILLLMVTLYITPTWQVSHAQESVTAEAFRIVNIRSGAGTANAIIGQLSPGETVTVIGRSNTNNDWLLVQSGGVTGWVAYFVVSVTGDPETLPVIGEDVASESTSPDAGIEAVSDGAGAVDGVRATTFRRANVRLLPDVDSPILLVLQRSETVAVIGRSDGDNDWLQIETSAGIGWIAYFLVSVEGDLEQLPTVQALPAEPAASRNEIIVTTRFNANLRAAPSTSAALIQTVPFATELAAQGRNTGNVWLLVRYGEQTGWILRALVRTTDDTARLPIAAGT